MTRYGATVALMFLSFYGCTSILHSPGQDDTSTDFEPPPSWVGGVKFLFADSSFTSAIGEFAEPSPALSYGAQVDFYDGRRFRRVEGRDVFQASNGSIRTPWYRVWMPEGGGEHPLTVRITIGDAAGESSVSEYMLKVRPDNFYSVLFGVTTNPNEPPTPWTAHDVLWYPVPPGARRAATDSLFVGWVVRGRECFDCPS